MWWLASMEVDVGSWPARHHWSNIFWRRQPILDWQVVIMYWTFNIAWINPHAWKSITFLSKVRDGQVFVLRRAQMMCSVVILIVDFSDLRFSVRIFRLGVYQILIVGFWGLADDRLLSNGHV